MEAKKSSGKQVVAILLLVIGLAAGKPGQDNYTAIALKYHGKKEEAE